MTCFNNAGALPGVTTIYQAQCYQTRQYRLAHVDWYPGRRAARAADFNLYWGAGGVIDSVIDATHNVVGAVRHDGGRIVGRAEPGRHRRWARSRRRAPRSPVADFACVEPYRPLRSRGRILCPAGTPSYQLSNTAVPGAIGFFSGGAYPPTAANVPAAGNGFVLYISGRLVHLRAGPGGAVAGRRHRVVARASTSARSPAVTARRGAQGPTPSQPRRHRPLTAVGVDGCRPRSPWSTTWWPATSGRPRAGAHRARSVLRHQPVRADDDVQDHQVRQSARRRDHPDLLVERRAGRTCWSTTPRTFGGAEDWNVRNRNNQVVASGVYFYHISKRVTRDASAGSPSSTLLSEQCPHGAGRSGPPRIQEIERMSDFRASTPGSGGDATERTSGCRQRRRHHRITRTIPPSAPPPPSSCCSAPAPAAPRWVGHSRPSRPTSARCTTTPPASH